MESHDYSSHFYVQCRLFERNSRVRTEKQKFIRLEIYQNDKEILYIHRRYQVAISQEIFSQVLLSTNLKKKSSIWLFSPSHSVMLAWPD